MSRIPQRSVPSTLSPYGHHREVSYAESLPARPVSPYTNMSQSAVSAGHESPLSDNRRKRNHQKDEVSLLLIGRSAVVVVVVMLFSLLAVISLPLSLPF